MQHDPEEKQTTDLLGSFKDDIAPQSEGEGDEDDGSPFSNFVDPIDGKAASTVQPIAGVLDCGMSQSCQ